MSEYSHWRALVAKKRYGYKSARGTSRKATHSSYEGGILCVPLEGLPELYAAIATDVQANPKARFYFTEFHTDVFPMYFDVDLKALELGVREQVADALRAVLATQVAKFYPDADAGLFDTIWCAAQAAEPLTGLHIYMWKLLVTVEQALQIRHSLVVAIRAAYPLLLPKGASWEDVIDKAVYSGGMRMPGALLLKECTHCKEAGGHQNNPYCPAECIRGKVCVGRRYVFHDLVTRAPSDEAKQDAYHLRNNWGALLKRCSLRTDQPATPGYAVYPGCPLPDDKGHRKTSADCVTLDDGTMAALLNLVRSLHPMYAAVVVDRVTKLDRGARYSVYISGENAKWCENAGRYHTSSRAYFEIRVSGIRTRCGCRKQDLKGRKFGLCSKYETGWTPLPPELRAALFPNKGPAVDFARALKRRRDKVGIVDKYSSQAKSELTFGQFVKSSAESSTSTSARGSACNSAGHSRRPSVSFPAAPQLDSGEVCRRLASVSATRRK